MQIPRKSIAMVATFVVTMLLFSVFAFHSVKTDSAPKPAGRAASLEVPTSSTDGHVNGSVHSAMNNAFDNGFLPQPAAPSGSDLDAVIADLAKRIAARNEASIPALLTALQESGFSIRAKSREIWLHPIDKSQGLAFEAWEVAAMAKLYGQHCSISISDLSASLVKGMPELAQVLTPDVIAQRIAESAEGSQPLRSWSRLIIELGKQSEQPYDLSAKDADLSRMQLDPIQQALIMRRIAGDLIASRKPSPHDEETTMRGKRVEFTHAQLREAVYHAQSPARVLRTAETSSSPCILDDNGAIIVDWNGIGWTTEWQKIVDIEKQMEGPELAARVNAALILVRFFLIYAGLDADITIDKTPLVRTQDTSSGETANLTADVTWKLDQWDLACFVAILRAFTAAGYGLDVGNLPNQEGVNGAGVTWILTECGVDRNINPVNEQLLDLYEKNAIVAFEPGQSFEGKHNLVNQITNEGKATIPIYGLPQRRDLSKDHPQPVMKPCAVALEVKFKDADPKQVLGDLSDVIGPALGLASGDVLGGLVGGITEMLYRMSWRMGDEFEFWVKDWSAKPVWVGTITYIETYKDDKPPYTREEAPKAIRTDQISDDRDGSMTVVLTPEVNSLGMQIVKATASHKSVLSIHSAGNSPVCTWTTDAQKTDNMPEQHFQGTVSVTVLGSLGTYSVTPQITGDMTWTHEESARYKSSCPSKSKDFDFTNSYVDRFQNYWNSASEGGAGIVNAIPDQKHPDELHGSTPVFTPGLGQTGAITWDLRKQ